MSMLTRKKFIISSVGGAAGIILLPGIVTAQQTQTAGKAAKSSTIG